MEDLVDLCSYILGRGLNLKLYFMIGVPGERRPSEGIINLIHNIVSSTRLVRKEQIRVTINPLIPKAHTPMQYFPLVDKEYYRREVNYVKEELGKLGIRVSTYDWRWAFAQALIGLAGREISRLLITWALRGGGLGSLRAALRELRYDYSYVFKRKDIDYEFPWSKVVLGLEGLIRREALNLT